MMEAVDRTVLDMIVNSGAENIALCAVGHKRKDLITSLKRVGISVDIYDYHPHLNVDDDYFKVDIIMDEDLNLQPYDLIVHMSAERTYPIGKVHSGQFIIVYDHTEHNGSCTHYPNEPFEHLISENNLEEFDRARVGMKLVVHGITLQ